MDFVSELLEIIFGGDGTGMQEIIEFCLENQDALAVIIAYLAKYMDSNDISSDEIDELLEMLGLDSLDEIFSFSIGSVTIAGLSDLINLAIKNLNDIDNSDTFIMELLSAEWFVQKISQALESMGLSSVDFDFAQFWQAVDSKVKTVNASGGCSTPSVKSGRVRNFSGEVYEVLINAINSIENIGSCSVSSWSNYSEEDWYSSLLIKIAVKGINGYFSRLTQTNSGCKSAINTVFENVWSLDKESSARIESSGQSLQDICGNIAVIGENIAV